MIFFSLYHYRFRVVGRFWVKFRFQLWIFLPAKWHWNVALKKLGFSVPQMILWFSQMLRLNHSGSKRRVWHFCFILLYCIFLMHPIAASSDTIRRQRWIAFATLGFKAAASQQYCKPLKWFHNYHQQLAGPAETVMKNAYQTHLNYETVSSIPVRETGKHNISQIFLVSYFLVTFLNYLNWYSGLFNH